MKNGKLKAAKPQWKSRKKPTKRVDLGKALSLFRTETKRS